MNDKDDIKDLFSEKLANHEVPVKSELWNAIQSQIGTAAASTTAGVSLATKWLIGVASSLAITGTVVWYANSDKVENQTTNEIQLVEEKSSENEKLDEVLPEDVSVQKESQEITQKEPAFINLNQENITSSPLIEDIKTPENREDTRKSELTSENKQTVENKEQISSVPQNAKEEIASEITPQQTPSVVNTTENPQSLDLNEESTPVKDNYTEKQTLVKRLPNVITPNGDGDNDYLFLETNNVKDFQITILNAKNEVVFTSDNPNFKWNALDKFGNPVPSGFYSYFVIIFDQEGNKFSEYTKLQVVR